MLEIDRKLFRSKYSRVDEFSTPAPGGGFSVAIVDDHVLYRQTVSRYLHMLGFNVAMEAANGMEFIHLLETCSSFPEACLLDVEMPLMDGVATTRVLRARYPGPGGRCKRCFI